MRFGAGSNGALFFAALSPRSDRLNKTKRREVPLENLHLGEMWMWMCVCVCMEQLLGLPVFPTFSSRGPSPTRLHPQHKVPPTTASHLLTLKAPLRPTPPVSRSSFKTSPSKVPPCKSYMPRASWVSLPWGDSLLVLVFSRVFSFFCATVGNALVFAGEAGIQTARRTDPCHALHPAPSIVDIPLQGICRPRVFPAPQKTLVGSQFKVPDPTRYQFGTFQVPLQGSSSRSHFNRSQFKFPLQGPT